MLATVRIGAIHSVVFAGFGARRARRPDRGERLAARLHRRRHLPQGQGRRRSSRSSTTRCDAGAAATSSTSSSCGAAPRPTAAASRRRARLGRLPRGAATGSRARTRTMEAERAGLHPRDLRHDRQAEAGRPHARRLPGPHRQHGPLGASGCEPDDVWWATSDIGWIVGHSYIVYAPLLAGCTTVAYEGALDHPDAGRQLAVIGARSSASPASSRRRPRSALLMRYGDEPLRAHRPFARSSASSAPARC